MVVCQRGKCHGDATAGVEVHAAAKVGRVAIHHGVAGVDNEVGAVLAAAKARAIGAAKVKATTRRGGCHVAGHRHAAGHHHIHAVGREATTWFVRGQHAR